MSTDPTEIPIDLPVSEQLEGIPDLGGEVEGGGFFARVADQPIADSLGAVLRRTGTSDSRADELFKRFELWCIPHRVSITRRSGFAEPVSVGLEIAYLNDSRTCSIVSLFPAFQYVVHGRLSGSASFGGKLSPTGEILGTDREPAVGAGQELSVSGLKLFAATSGEITLHLESTVSTPIVSAVGVGSSVCEWRFEKQREPLFGQDIETWAVVALPKRQRELRYRARFYFTERTFFFQTRRQSEWIDVACALNH